MKLIASFVLIVSFAILSQPALAQTDTTTLIKAGDHIPNFTLSNSTKTITSASLTHKIVWINFFATWCGPCRQELPELQKKVWEAFKNNPKFELLVVGRQHTAEEVDAFVKAQGFTMPFYPDPQRTVYGLFATSYIPRNVIVDENGTVVFSSIGFESTEFEKMIDYVKSKLNTL